MQLAYTPDKDRTSRTVIAYNTYAYKFHSIAAGRYAKQFSINESGGGAFGMYYAGIGIYVKFGLFL